ncbi:hypothetical protein ACFV94_09320 [Streptomyces sp. NPDC059896]|uniref:hypothetical protein n=1 Tax=Streptomyces sp. NPDC059896 TaxID=3346993 RepID=UPI00365352A8
MYGLVFVLVIEAIGMWFLLAPFPVAHLIMLLIDLHTVFLALGLHAAAVTARTPWALAGCGYAAEHGSTFGFRST